MPPLLRTLLLYPFQEEMEKYKKKNTELQKAMNEYKDNVDMTFEEFLKVSGVGSSPALTTCKSSQVLLAGVSGGFPGVLPFRPPTEIGSSL